MMEIKLRTTRTLKVTEVAVTSEESELLAQLYLDPRYDALLDVMERACISLDTTHLNTSVGEPEAVLGGHCLAKSGWLFFTYIQKQVLNAYHTRHSEPGEESSPPTLEEVLQGIE